MKVIQLNNAQENWFEMVDELKNTGVTHAIIVYRKMDGDLYYKLCGADNITFLIGMLDRVKQEMHFLDRFDG